MTTTKGITGILLLVAATVIGFVLYYSFAKPLSPLEANDQSAGPESINRATPEHSLESKPQQPSGQRSSDSEFRVPVQFVFAGNQHVSYARSWEELTAGYSEADRGLIDEFVHGLPRSAYQFSSIEELRWMVQRGFPMPDDVLSASLIDDSELLGLALAGNTKAAFFYLDRLYSADSWPSNDFLSAEQKWRVKAAALTGQSPFSGYLEAARLAREYPESPTAAAGALAWVAMKGDTRAREELRQPGIEPHSMLSWMMFLQGEEDQLRQLGLLHGGSSLSLQLRIPTPDADYSVPLADGSRN